MLNIIKILLQKRLALNGFLSEFIPLSFIRFGALFLSFIIALVLARLLGPEAYGAYAFAIALFTILQPIAGGGLGTMVVRELADPALDGAAKSRLAGVFVAAAAGLSILVAALAAGFSWLLLGAERPTLALAVLVIPAMVLVETVRGALVGQRRVKQGQFVSELAKPGLFLLALGGLFLIPEMPVGAGAALLAFGLAGWLVVLATLRSGLITLPKPGSGIFAQIELRKLLRRSMPFAVISAMQYFNTRIDILAIGYLMTNADAGHYQVATKLANLVSLPASLIAILMAPRFAAAFRADQFGRLRGLYWQAQMASVLLSVPGFILFFFAGGWVVVTMFGASYAPAVAPLIILVFVRMLMSLRSASTMIMTMSRQEGSVMRAISVGVVGNILLNAMFIPQFGTVGAASTTAIMSCVTFAIMAVSLYRSRLLARDR